MNANRVGPGAGQVYWAGKIVCAAADAAAGGTVNVRHGVHRLTQRQKGHTLSGIGNEGVSIRLAGGVDSAADGLGAGDLLGLAASRAKQQVERESQSQQCCAQLN